MSSMIAVHFCEQLWQRNSFSFVGVLEAGRIIPWRANQLIDSNFLNLYLFSQSSRHLLLFRPFNFLLRFSWPSPLSSVFVY